MELFKKVIKLPSGVEATITEFVGKHQRLLTENPNEFQKGLNEIIQDVLISLGSKKVITMEDVENLLSCDRQAILIEARNLTVGEDKPFKFTWKYTHKGKKEELDLEYDFKVHGSFPITTVKMYDGNKNLVDADYKEYDQIKKIFTLTLPRSKTTAQFTMLDGKGEMVGERTKKKDRSSHTLLKMRFPKILHTKDGSNKPTLVSIDLDKAHLMDLEKLREKIKEVEGNVGTEIAFEHPETGEDVFVDALSTVAFFFPSEQI